MIGLRFEFRDQLLSIIQYKRWQIRALYACDSCPRDQETGALTREETEMRFLMHVLHSVRLRKIPHLEQVVLNLLRDS